MANDAQFSALFMRLKDIMQARAGHLRVLDDLPQKYSLMGPYMEQFKKDVWFGMVEVRKTYVSYHLMPVYMDPDLLNGISESLKKRMQGKACFNFTKTDEALFQELDELTGRCLTRFRGEGKE
jgi:hypothetical protein